MTFRTGLVLLSAFLAAVPALCQDQRHSQESPAFAVQPDQTAPLPDPNSPVQAGLSSLIRDVRLEKTKVCAGEGIRVTVVTNPASSVEVLVNGEVGNPRILEFRGKPGARRIRVVARSTEGKIESVRREVQLVACPEKTFPSLLAWANPYRELTVDFALRDAKKVGLAKGTYVWDFGDGDRAKTDIPFVSHDYGESLSSAKPYGQFEVRLTLAGRPEPVRRSLVLRNSSYFNRKKGIIRPLATTSRFLRKSERMLVGEFRVQNTEEEPLLFDRAREERQPCDPKLRARYRSVPVASVLPATAGSALGSAPSPSAGPGATRPFLLKSKQEIKGRVSLPETDLPPEVCGLAYHLLGRTKSGLRARASLYFEARPNRLLARKVAEPDMKRFLGELVRRKLVSDPSVITHEDLYHLSQQGLIRRTVKGWEVQP